MARTIRRKKIKFQDYIESNFSSSPHCKYLYSDTKTNVTLTNDMLRSLGYSYSDKVKQEYSITINPFPIPFHRLDKCGNNLTLNSWLSKGRWKRNNHSLDLYGTDLYNSKSPTTSHNYKLTILESFYERLENKFYSDSKRFLSIYEFDSVGNRWTCIDNTYYKKQRKPKYNSKHDDINLGLDEYYLEQEETKLYQERVKELNIIREMSLKDFISLYCDFDFDNLDL